MEIFYGGQLKEGDLIAISNGNHLTFGWYAGQGRGTLQYWWLNQPEHSYNHYETWLKTPADQRQKWYDKLYAKGFTRKCITKSYVNTVHASRVMRVTHPEDVFPLHKSSGWGTVTLLEYEKSKEILVKLNIIKQ